MIEFVLIFVLALYIYLGLSRIDRFVTYFIPVNFVYDLLIIYLNEGSVFPIIRGLLFTSISIYLLYKLGLPKNLGGILSLLLIFLTHLLVLGFVSDDMTKSLSETVKVFNILSVFLVGFSLYSKGHNIFPLLKTTQLVLWIMIINIIISNYIGVGFGGYNSTSFYTGSVYANGWYAPTIVAVIQIVLLFAPMKGFNKLAKSVRKNKIRYLIVFLSLILIVIGGRRSAVIIVLINMIVFVFYSSNRYKSILTIGMLGLVFLLTLPIYSDILENQYRNRLELNEEGLENENRYRETEMLWSEMLSFKNAQKSLFGENPFLTVGNYGGGALGDRYLHVDINIVLFSTGFVGLFIYGLIYFLIYKKSVTLFKPFRNDDSYVSTSIRLIFYSLYFASIALSFSGGFSAITYRSSTFLILGSILGYLAFKNKSYEISKTR